MSFLDRFRDGEEDEVELQPSQTERNVTHERGGEVELDDTGSQDDSDGFLPGTADDTTEQSSGSRQRSGDSDTSDRLDTVIQQNERIIELLESMTDDAGSTTSTTSPEASDELW